MLEFEEKEKLTIGELAKELDRTVLTIKKWERSGLIPKAKKNSRGWRYYTAEDINKMREFAETRQEKTEKYWRRNE